MTSCTHVIAARHVDPGRGRLTLDLPEGMTLREIVDAAIPGSITDIRQVRVALVTDEGISLIDPQFWGQVRPRPGVRVVIRVIAGKDALRSILAIVITVAALAAGQLWGAKLGAMLGVGTKIGTALVGMGVTALGNLLINALVPPVTPESRDAQNRYSISGWQNPYDPNGAVRDILGEIRVAPPFGALTHTEIVGDWQYVRALFCLGYGPLEISDLRIGETAISEYKDVEIEIRQGLPGDQPVTLLPRQIAEEAIGVELVRPLPRDQLGEVIKDQPGEATPVVRTTGVDASAASVILAFPAGVVRFDSKGRQRSETVRVRIEHRLVNASSWTLVTVIEITAKKLEAFYRQHTWTFPSRGRWQVRLTMLTDETTDTQIQRRTSWAALQTIRPEYPLNSSKQLALVALRVKATHQLSGALDSFNALVRKICLDWDHVAGAWVTRATSNPAALFRHVLQSQANPRPVADAGIDLEQLQAWHDFCRIKGLTYNRELAATGTLLRDVLAEIAAAGRAAPRHDGMRWSVVIDRPDQPVIDHISPRNSWGFRSSRTYVRHPDAFRVPFLDASNDYKPAERIVPRPGFVGVPELMEELVMPGKTRPAEVYREALRRWHEVLLRPDTYEVMQDGPVRVATRGDHVALVTDVLNSVQTSARVRHVAGAMIELDDRVTMEAGSSYAIRFITFAGAADTVGTSIVRPVETQPGETTTLLLTGSGDLPQEGAIILFGLAGQESYRLMVTGVEAAEGLTSILRLADVAPDIDSLVDSAVIPEWSGRIGAEVAASALPPSVPRITSVRSGMAWTDTAGMVDYLVEPGPGAVQVSTIQMEHRLAGAATWAATSFPVANGGGRISVYTTGQSIELRARAVSISGVPGPYTATVALTVGADDAPIPAALDADAVTVTSLLGGALVQAAIGSDPNISAVQIFRSMSAALDRATDAVGLPLDVVAQQSISLALGDTTRQSLIAGGTMDAPGAWTLGGAGWSITGGKATHATGAWGTLGQAAPFAAGKWYRVGFTVSGRSAGQILPRLTGGSTRQGAAVSANGMALDRIQAANGNDTFQLYADIPFDGSADNVVIYQETAACLAQGTHYIWLEPLNADGLPGPITGPIPVTII